jgi:uncharacterized membrane protein YeaQ/YmgE (transglycosylase-associated protein family)
MTSENWFLSCMAGFIVAWIANELTHNRYSFMINLCVGVFGAILLNIFVTTIEASDGHFYPTLGISALGAGVLLVVFHFTRTIERRQKR